MEAGLYLIPVNLSDGDLEDVLPRRNFDVVRSIRHFIVENERTARRFLKKCDKAIDIDSLTFYPLNEHTRPEETVHYLDALAQGEPMGVISEAGCPAVADPGADVVAMAQRRGFKVVPLVGPSSILLSLMASGFNGQSFAFQGYLPIDGGQTQIFIETPYRNNRLIAELAKALRRDLRLCVAYDITGADEWIATRTIAEWEKNQPTLAKKPAIFLLYK